MIDSYGMTYTELASELNGVSPKKRKEIQSGTIYDWVDESHEICGRLYDSVEVGEKLGYRYSYDYNELLFQQLQKEVCAWPKY